MTTQQHLSPNLSDHVSYDAVGQEILPLRVMAVFYGVPPQEVCAEFDRQMDEFGRFRVLKSWHRNAKALQAKYGTLDAAELFSRIVLGGDAE